MEIFPTLVANSTVAPNVGLKIALLRSRTGRTNEASTHLPMNRGVGGRPGGIVSVIPIPWTRGRRMFAEEEHPRRKMTTISITDAITELRSTHEPMMGRSGLEDAVNAVRDLEID